MALFQNSINIIQGKTNACFAHLARGEKWFTYMWERTHNLFCFLVLLLHVRSFFSAGGTGSGFYDTHPDTHSARLYVLENRGSLRAHAMALSGACLHDSHAFLLEDLDTFYLWCGRNTSCE